MSRVVVVVTVDDALVMCSDLWLVLVCLIACAVVLQWGRSDSDKHSTISNVR